MDDIKKELDRRIHEGVRNLLVSPLFEKGKTYNLSTQLEDSKGTLRPEYNHCWLTWQSRWEDENGNKHWGDEAFSFSTLEKAQESKSYLKKFIIE